MFDAGISKIVTKWMQSIILPKICCRYIIPLLRKVREPVGVKRVKGMGLDILRYFPATELTTSARKVRTEQR